MLKKIVFGFLISLSIFVLFLRYFPSLREPFCDNFNPEIQVQRTVCGFLQPQGEAMYRLCHCERLAEEKGYGDDGGNGSYKIASSTMYLINHVYNRSVSHLILRRTNLNLWTAMLKQEGLSSCPYFDYIKSEIEESRKSLSSKER